MKAKEATRRFQEAKRLYAEGQRALALVELDALDVAFPNSKNILYPRALCLAKLGRTAEAEAICDRLIEAYDDPRSKKLKERLQPQQTAPSIFTPIDLSDLDNLAARFAPKPAEPEPAWKQWWPYAAAGSLVFVFMLLTVSLLWANRDKFAAPRVARNEAQGPASTSPPPSTPGVPPPGAQAFPPPPGQQAFPPPPGASGYTDPALPAEAPDQGPYEAEGERSFEEELNPRDALTGRLDYQRLTPMSYLVILAFFAMSGLPLYLTLALFDKLPYNELWRDLMHTWLVSLGVHATMRFCCCCLGFILGVVAIHRIYYVEWPPIALWLVLNIIFGILEEVLLIMTMM